MEKIFHSIIGAWVGFERTNRRGGVSRRKVERELVKDNQGGPSWMQLRGPDLLTTPLLMGVSDVVVIMAVTIGRDKRKKSAIEAIIFPSAFE